MKKKQTDISKSLNYIRAYMRNDDIANFIGVSKATVTSIANNKSNSKPATRELILELEARTRSQVATRQAEYKAQANNKSLSPMQRSLARARANDLAKGVFTNEESNKRQAIIKEQEPLPNMPIRGFLSFYANGKTQQQLEKELGRFTDRGIEVLVTRVGNKFLFSRKPLYSTTRVHVRGVVYINDFSAGINQIVKDTSGMFDPNQTVKSAIEQGDIYFHQCFKGVNALEINKDFMNNGLLTAERSRGEKYADISKWLTERYYLGVFLY